MAYGIDAARGHRACPHCGGDFRLSTAESSKYLLCTECGLVRMLPFAALNPHSALLDTFPHPTAV